MPSDKKRINLTVPDNIYHKLLQYKEDNGLTSDATACLQLIVQQLKSQENSKALFRMMATITEDDYRVMAQDGYATIQDLMNKMPEQQRKKYLSD